MKRKIELRASMNSNGYRITLVINGVDFYGTGDAVLGADAFADQLRGRIEKTYGSLNDSPQEYADIIEHRNAAIELASTFDVLIKRQRVRGE